MGKPNFFAALLLLVLTISLYGLPMEKKENGCETNERKNHLSIRERLEQSRRITNDNDRLLTEERGTKCTAVDGGTVDEDVAERSVLTPEEQLLHDQIKKALIQQVRRTPENQTHYNQVNKIWENLDAAWEEQSASYNELQMRRKQVALSETRLEQAQFANTEEERQKTIFGQIAKYAAMATGSEIVQNASDPIIKGLSTGITLAGGFASVINNAWSQFKLTAAEVLHEEHVVQNHQKALDRANKACETIHELEKQTDQAKRRAVEEERIKTFNLANQLSPQASWGAVEWQRWTQLTNFSEAQIGKLIELGKTHLMAVQKLSSDIWQERIKAVEEELLQVISERNGDLKRLAKKYRGAEYLANQATDKVAECERNLKDSRQEETQEELKKTIEQLADEMSALESQHPTAFESKKKDFLKHLNELHKTQQRLSQQIKNLEEARDKERDAQMALWSHSQAYRLTKEPIMRRYERTKLKLQVDQEAWRRHWSPTSHQNDYQYWSMPELTYDDEENVALSVQQPVVDATAIQNVATIDPPKPLLKDLEGRGRFLRLYQDKQPSVEGSSTILDEEHSSTSSKIFRITSSNEFREMPLPPSEQVMKRVINSDWLEGAASEIRKRWNDRWDALKRVEELEIKIKKVGRAWKKKKSEETANAPQRGKQVDSIEMETGSIATTIRTKTGTLFSFGRAHVPTSRDLSSELNLEQKNAEELWQEFYSLCKEQKEKNEKWIELQKEAEQQRVEQQEGARIFEHEDQSFEAWQKADLEAIKGLLAKEKEKQAAEAAQSLRESWEKNIERWNARAVADQRQKELKKCQEKLVNAPSYNERQPLHEEEKSLNEACRAAEQDWKQLAKEYYGRSHVDEVMPEKAEEELKKNDQAVNRRWEQVLNSYEPKQFMTLDEGESQQRLYESQLEIAKDLSSNLHQDYESSKLLKRNEGAAAILAEYRERALKKALHYAQQDRTGAEEELAQAWENVINSQDPPEKQPIDKEAQELFAKETKRLEKIETLWREIIENKLREKEEAILLAAKRHHEGDPSLWYQLSEHERNDYHAAVEEENKEYHDSLRDKEEVISQLQNNLQNNIATNVSSFNERQQLKQQLQDLQQKYQQRRDDLARGEADFLETKLQEEERVQRSLAEQAERKNMTLEDIRSECDQLQRLVLESKTKAISLPSNYEKNFWNANSDSLSESIEYLNKLIDSISLDKEEVAKLWREAANKSMRAAAEYKRAAETIAVEKDIIYLVLARNVAVFFDMEAKDAKYRAQAAEAEEVRKADVAQKWRELAKFQNCCVELCKESIFRTVASFETSIHHSQNLAECLYSVVKKLGKAIEAEQAGKPNVAEGWREVAKLQNRCIEPFQKAAEAYAARNMNEGNSRRNMGNSFYHAADKLGKAIEAETFRKLDAAQKWRAAAAKYEQSGEKYKQAAEAYASGRWFSGASGFFSAGQALTIEADELAAEAEKM